MSRIPGSNSVGPILTLLLAATLAAPAAADVVVKQRTVSQGLGGFGDGTSLSTMTVAGDKSRSDDEFTYTGRFKTLVGKKPKKSATIMRVDKEVIWTLDDEKKKYREMTFAEMREAMEKAMAEAQQAGAPPADTKPKDAEMTFTLDVKKGGSETVNGYPCQNLVITCVGKPKDAKAAEANAEIKLVMDQWLAKDVPGQKEMTDFYKSYAKALGLDPEFSRMSAMARAMYGNAMKEMATKLKDVEGYPMRSTFTIQGFEPTQEQKAEMEKAKAESKEQQADARKQADQADKAQDVSDAATVGSAAAQGEDVKGGIGGFLGRKLGNAMAKKAEEKSKKASEGGSSGGPLFKVVTEVESIAITPAAPGAFEVTGYEKEKK